MQVILLEKINKLGSIGDIVDVKSGFGRNYLIPNGKALRATNDNKAVFESRKKEFEDRNAALVKEAEGLAKKLEGKSVSVARQASEDGKLYGSVLVRDVAQALAAEGVEVDNSTINLVETIKELGEYKVKIIPHAEVVIEIDVNVVRAESN